eukprot:1156470-Pelagomonas_calceolata.AAC.5
MPEVVVEGRMALGLEHCSKSFKETEAPTTLLQTLQRDRGNANKDEWCRMLWRRGGWHLVWNFALNL